MDAVDEHRVATKSNTAVIRTTGRIGTLGIVIDAVQWVAHAACLGCQWIDMPGTDMKDPRWREDAAAVGRRHESSHGEFRGQPDQ
jgi:hypothetical protein